MNIPFEMYPIKKLSKPTNRFEYMRTKCQTYDETTWMVVEIPISLGRPYFSW